MAWPAPQFSRKQVTRAGEILVRTSEPENRDYDWNEFIWAGEVVNNWRSCHGYPINTFQATLRQRLSKFDSKWLVAQRLKRMSSIIQKLRRFEGMQLSRMQDIGGLRAVLTTCAHVRRLEADYRDSSFKHELVASRDYINYPKSSGYRSVHLIYRYCNPRAANYNGLLLELQIRSRLQHAWATAVETMGTFLQHALKSSEGPERWLNFFSLAGSAFAHLENTPAVPQYNDISKKDTFVKVLAESRHLQVRERLLAFTIAAERVHADRKAGSYHLILLDPVQKTVTIRTYGQANLEVANQDYADEERKITQGQPIQAVLVSAGPIEDLRKAYPNFFLDTREFIKHLDRLERQV